MGVYTNITAALNTRLSSLASHPPIAWPNTKYIPIIGTTYLRPTLLPAETVLSSLARGQTHRGIYQVDVFVPVEKGINTLTTWLDAIEGHFAAQDILVSSSTKVYILQTGISEMQREDAWFSGHIFINYLVYT